MQKYLISLSLLTTLFCANANAQSSDACAVIKAHEGWGTALNTAHDKYGIGKGAIMAIIDQESRFKATASNGIYKGYSQASPQTWAWFVRDAKMGSASRADFSDSALFVGWHFKTMSKKLGVSMSNVYGQYMAYKLGEGGYRKGGSKSAKSISSKVSNRAAIFEKQLADCL